MRFSQKLGKKELLFRSAAILSVTFLLLYIAPAEFMRESGAMYALPVALGLAFGIQAIVPEALLSDVIDYDELHCGVRREGMYVVLETSVAQVMAIIAGALPDFMLAAAGFENNGGCSCGCGVACPNYFERWRCPGDTGYACDGSLNSIPQLFYGVPRRPPCLKQPPAVTRMVMVLIGLVPALMFAVAAFFCLFASIDSTTHAAIVKQT